MTQATKFTLSLMALIAFLLGPQCLAACDLSVKSARAEEHACCPSPDSPSSAHDHGSPLEQGQAQEIACAHPPLLMAAHFELLQKPKPYTGIFPDNIMQPYDSLDIPWIATQEDIGKTSYQYILRPFFLQHHQWLC